MPVHYSRMMNSENASKKIVQSLIDLVNLAKWLIDENQKPSVTQELGRLFPSIIGWGRSGESSKLLRVVLVNHLLQQLIQITLVLQHGLPQNGRLKKFGDQEQHQRNHWSLCRIKQPQEKAPSNFAILSRVKPSDFRFATYFMSFLKFDLPQL